MPDDMVSLLSTPTAKTRSLSRTLPPSILGYTTGHLQEVAARRRQQQQQQQQQPPQQPQHQATWGGEPAAASKQRRSATRSSIDSAPLTPVSKATMLIAKLGRHMDGADGAGPAALQGAGLLSQGGGSLLAPNPRFAGAPRASAGVGGGAAGGGEGAHLQLAGGGAVGGAGVRDGVPGQQMRGGGFVGAGLRGAGSKVEDEEQRLFLFELQQDLEQSLTKTKKNR